MPYREIYLTLVSAENNNKFYHMIQDNEHDDTFVAKYGRVDLTSTDQVYPVHQWDKKYKEKIKKGYRDLTSLRAVSSSSSTFKDLDYSIADLINKLQSYSSNAVKTNYNIAVGAVTPLQLQAAQHALNEALYQYETLMDMSKVSTDALAPYIQNINNNLLELYTVLPRKMEKVQWYLVNEETTSKEISRMLSNEQDILDSLSTQVSLHNVNDKEDQTLLDALGLKVEFVNDSDTISYLKNLMTDSSHLFHKAYRVTNHITQLSYNSSDALNERELFHSSRNANWLSILENGLLIRPSGVATTGSMLGDAIYFADKAKKSIGYSSLENSYWAGGNSKEAYLAVYEVRLGNSLHLKSYADLQKHRYNLNYNDLRLSGHNSVFADASYGGWLYNNEYTVYHPNQCTIKYLIELKK